jgi:hypothetical protein
LAAAETIETSKTSTEERTALARTLATVETPTTILALAGTSTAKAWSPTTNDLSRKFAKKLSERRKFHEKKSKSTIFSAIDFDQSVSDPTIGSSILLVRKAMLARYSDTFLSPVAIGT